MIRFDDIPKGNILYFIKAFVSVWTHSSYSVFLLWISAAYGSDNNNKDCHPPVVPCVSLCTWESGWPLLPDVKDHMQSRCMVNQAMETRQDMWVVLLYGAHKVKWESVGEVIVEVPNKFMMHLFIHTGLCFIEENTCNKNVEWQRDFCRRWEEYSFL